MNSSPFTLRSHQDLIATFRQSDQKSVIVPKGTPYPVAVDHYFAWTEPSGVYTYIVFKRSDWEIPRGLVFQRNGAGTHIGPAGMCDWCHHSGPSDEVGLLTTTMTPHSTGGTWLCLDLSCQQKIEAIAGFTGKQTEKRMQKLDKKIGDFYLRARPE
jgi:hypothetical protein